MLQQINDKLMKPIVTAPPFQWAQSLHALEFEIKYAYRHDVAGCADLFNQTVSIKKDIFYIGASCKELDQTMFFELHFKFWDEVDADTVKIERRPVGKLYVRVQKLTAPARWKQLWLEDTPKPQLMRLWFEKHQRNFHELADFEDDDIEDFAGHDIIEDEEEDDPDDMAWLHPPKGPGEFKNLKKKKRGKKNKKKSKKVKKTKKSKKKSKTSK